MVDHALADLAPHILNGPTGRRWFGDGAPTWNQGRAGKPAKTSGEAEGERRQLVKVLRRHGKGDKAALRLADKISACQSRRRCLSGACPECMRATQRFSVATNADLLARSGVSTVAVSVVFRGAGIADGKLEFEPELFGRISRRLRAALRKAGVRQAIGGFDVSANEHADQRFASHYRPHAWIMVPASQFARGEKVFRGYLSPEQDRSPPGICEVLRRGPQGAGLRRQDRLCPADIAATKTSGGRARHASQHA